MDAMAVFGPVPADPVVTVECKDKPVRVKLRGLTLGELSVLEQQLPWPPTHEACEPEKLAAMLTEGQPIPAAKGYDAAVGKTHRLRRAFALYHGIQEGGPRWVARPDRFKNPPDFYAQIAQEITAAGFDGEAVGELAKRTWLLSAQATRGTNSSAAANLLAEVRGGRPHPDSRQRHESGLLYD